MMTNVYAPFSLPFHLAICVVATLFYGFMFLRKKHSHYFTLILAFDLTLLTQINIKKSAFYVLTITEIFLILLIILSVIRVSRENKKREKHKKAVDETDVIDNAFSDENI